MNIKSMRLRSYRSFAVDEHVPPEAAERYRTLKGYERVRAGLGPVIWAQSTLQLSIRQCWSSCWGSEGR